MSLDLYAAETGELLASVPLPGAATVNVENRIVAGLAVPWNVVGSPSTGRTVFRPSSITVPGEAAWVKLLKEHDPNQSLGFLNDHADVSAGLLAALRVEKSVAGDAAIAAVLARSRDAFSVRVEVDQWNQLAGGLLEIISSRLREISLVAVPAYDTARASVFAALPSIERDQVMVRLQKMLDVQASAPGTGEPVVPAAPVAAPAAPAAPVVPAAPVAAPAAPVVQAGAPAFDLGQLAQLLAPHLAAAPAAPGEIPAGPPNGAPAGGIATVRAAAQTVADWRNEGNGNVGELLAALSDVVPANDAGGGSTATGNGQPQWLGELWTASESDRNYIDALGTPRPLTSLKAKGWRWVTRPVVGTYAGNKAAIPSAAVATEPAEATAHRTAGGWDVDRVFFDLGDPEFITALFVAATEDYRRKSDAYAGSELLAGAAGTITGTPDTLVTGLVALGAAAGAIGARVTMLAMAADVWGDFAALTKDDIPWWMGSGDSMDLATGKGNAGGFRFWSDPALAAGTLLAADSRAATYYEAGAVPIKVQAQNIPNGGVDLGVFGYSAVIVNDERAIWSVDLGAGA